MYKFGHIGTNLVLYIPVAFVLITTGFSNLVVEGATIMVSLSTAPDIDQTLPRITHRGITHTVWTPIIVGTGVSLVALSMGLIPVVSVLLGLIGGYAIIGHLLGDVITPMGLTPFYPLTERHYTLGLVEASDVRANRILLFTGSTTFTAFVYVVML